MILNVSILILILIWERFDDGGERYPRELLQKWTSASDRLYEHSIERHKSAGSSSDHSNANIQRSADRRDELQANGRSSRSQRHRRMGREHNHVFERKREKNRANAHQRQQTTRVDFSAAQLVGRTKLQHKAGSLGDDRVWHSGEQAWDHSIRELFSLQSSGRLVRKLSQMAQCQPVHRRGQRVEHS